jgi:hypothetical protein
LVAIPKSYQDEPGTMLRNAVAKGLEEPSIRPIAEIAKPLTEFS